MKKIIFVCDMCGQTIKWEGLGEPNVTYESWRYADIAGGSSSASNQVHVCAACTRIYLRLILIDKRTIEEVVEIFGGKDKSRQKK